MLRRVLGHHLNLLADACELHSSLTQSTLVRQLSMWMTYRTKDRRTRRIFLSDNGCSPTSSGDHSPVAGSLHSTLVPLAGRRLRSGGVTPGAIRRGLVRMSV